jgi:hypothetical protein
MADSQPDSMVPAVDVSTEYDADMSASLDNTQVPSASEVRPKEDIIGIESSPASSATQSSEVKKVDDSIVDVFGPANAALPKPAPKRKGRKAQRGMCHPR